MNLKKLFDYSVPLVSAATILTVGALVIAVIGMYTARDIKLSQDNIEMTGSAKMSVVSDTARWVINLETKTGINNQQSGYVTLEKETDKILNYLTSQSFTDYETPAITSSPNYTYPREGDPIFTGYSVSRQIVIRSSDIDAISDLTNNIEPFTGTGYTVSTQSLELTYSKLDEMRVKLLGEAIKDAKARAEAIASESGRSISVLRNASGGVVQVLPQDGIEISDYGSYDTQSKNKEIMVTVRATFEL